MTEAPEFRLTQFSRGAGCGCKIAPAVLKEILYTADEFPPFPGLLVGNESSDDAAVLEISDDLALISTTDFFMPVVDDAYDFGRIAAANAISDIYAMGGKPVLAVAILGWPIEKLPAALATRVLDGARSICRMAGIPLAGGHSIDSQEPLFGLAVNGLINKKNLKRNNTGREGDLLFLTKPLGLGIVTTAAKRGLAAGSDLETAVHYMCSLNRVGETLGGLEGVHALTDITGFGLLGHLMEFCEGCDLGAEVQFGAVPRLPGLDVYMKAFIYPDMTMKTWSALSGKVNALDAEKLLLLCDPQTSGGLLVAVDPASVEEYLSVIRDHGLGDLATTPIGKLVVRKGPVIHVT